MSRGPIADAVYEALNEGLSEHHKERAMLVYDSIRSKINVDLMMAAYLPIARQIIQYSGNFIDPDALATVIIEHTDSRLDLEKIALLQMGLTETEDPLAVFLVELSDEIMKKLNIEHP